MQKSLIRILAFFVILLTCQSSDNWMSIGLKDSFSFKGLFLGTAVTYQSLKSDRKYQKQLLKDYRLITPEHFMKWSAIETQQGKYSFEKADAVVRFAQKNKLIVKGHTLIWYFTTPSWVKKQEQPSPWASSRVVLHQGLRWKRLPMSSSTPYRRSIPFKGLTFRGDTSLWRFHS